jgi:transcriptional regulator with XRE-family HTH domain
MIEAMTLYEKINRLSALKGWGQSEVARRLKVSRSTVQPWFSGQGKPSYDLLLPLARVLGVSVDFLLDDTLDEPPKELTEEERFVLRTIRALEISADEAFRLLSGHPAATTQARPIDPNQKKGTAG